MKNYNLEVVAGIKMPKLFSTYGKKTKKNYLRDFIALNRDVLQNRYDIFLESHKKINDEAYKKALASNPTLEKFVAKRFPGRKKKKKKKKKEKEKISSKTFTDTLPKKIYKWQVSI